MDKSNKSAREPEPPAKSPDVSPASSTEWPNLPRLARGIRYKPFRKMIAEKLDGKPLDPTKRRGPGT